MTLQELITNCTTQQGSKRELAWREFFRRYKNKIFYFIERSCNQWNLSRLQLQRRDVLDDVLSEVLFSLTQKLVNFKNLDSEKKFVSWLQVICNRTTGNYLKRVFKNTISEVDVLDIPIIKKGHEDIILWELQEFIVGELRQELPKGTENIERDINIFLLNVWFGFPPKLIAGHPCYRLMSINAIEKVISKVKKNITFF